MTHVQLSRGSPETFTTLRVHPEAFVTSGILVVVLHPEDIFDLEPHSASSRPLPLRSPHLLRIFSTLRPSPFRGFSSEPAALITDHFWSPPVAMQFHSPARSAIPTNQRRWSRPLRNPASAYWTVTIIHQFRLHANILVRYILSFFKEKVVASWTLKAHIPPH